jgi:hypothetical protein
LLGKNMKNYKFTDRPEYMLKDGYCDLK